MSANGAATRSGTPAFPHRAPLQWSSFFLIAALLALLLDAPGARAASPEAQATEYQIKAAYIYKFTGYVDWSSRTQLPAGNTVVIGVMGADRIADELRQVAASHEPHDPPIAVRTLVHGESMAGVHVLFIGRSIDDPGALLLAARRSGVLTITESEDAFEMGSVINFITVGDKVRFDIALQAADAAHLRISSRLLAVARKVV
jgi:hypothetical protein